MSSAINYPDIGVPSASNKGIVTIFGRYNSNDFCGCIVDNFFQLFCHYMYSLVTSKHMVLTGIQL